jgi:hypothetical protein
MTPRPVPARAILTDMSPDDLAAPAIEQLAEDERLRGDLTDDGFLPLQTWAVARLTDIARDAADERHPQAVMQAAAQTLRRFVAAAVAAAEAGRLGDLPRQVRAPVVQAQNASRVRAALQRIVFGPDADANARAIAGALAADVPALDKRTGERT